MPTTPLIVVLLSLLPAALRGGEPDVDWAEVLGPPRGRWAAPQDELLWRDDLRAALAEAQLTDRPLFVTLRCLPCAQCADFDRDVLEGGPLLSPLLRRFVTVRLTDARQLDLGLLPSEGFQDLDLSWWGWFLSPAGETYGVFGGRDEVSDATRISEAALAATLARVLDHHHDPRRAGWSLDGPARAGADTRPPASLPGYASWAAGPTVEKDASCLHCHQVAEVLRQPALDAGTFDKARDLDVWPLPENVGLVVDRDDGLLVTSVREGSPAAEAGVRAGDVVRAADGRLLFGQADLRGVLHRSADPSGAVPLVWTRDGAVHEGVLALSDGWRDTVLDWRMSVTQGNVGAHPGFGWPLPARHPDVPADAMCVEPFLGGPPGHVWPAVEAGLRGHHRIVAVDGERPPLAGRPFLAWFRMRHEPGDEVALTVLDRGEERELRYVLPER